MNPQEIESPYDVNELMDHARPRNITSTDTPMGQEFVVYFDYDGFSWRFEAKYNGGTYLHYRDSDGDWAEVWSSR